MRTGALIPLLIAALLSSAVSAQPAPRSVQLRINSLELLKSSAAEGTLPPGLSFSSGPTRGATVLSSDRRQALTVFMHPGGVGQVAEMSVRYATTSDRRSKVLPSGHHFETEAGIKLGTSGETILALLGPPTKRVQGGARETLSYRLKYTEPEAQPFLSKYNMPVYYGTYHLKAGKLVEFSVGFEYP